jgi:hypothetical protein
VRNQALPGLAHRLSPSYPGLGLNRVGFGHVYAVTDPPEYRDYRFSSLDNLGSASDAALLRRVFVAFQTARDPRSLMSLLN